MVAAAAIAGGLFGRLGRRSGRDGFDVGNDGRWCRCAAGAGGRVRSNASNGVSGGGTDAAAAADAAWIASRRWRNSATWFMAFRAKISATIAISEREENEGVVEHQASRRARQSGNRPRPQPGCNPVSAALPAKSSMGPRHQRVIRVRTRCGAQRCSAEPGPRSQRMDPDQQRTTLQAQRAATSGERRVIPDRAGTAGLRRSCCRGPFRPARAASGPRAPAPCRRG